MSTEDWIAANIFSNLTEAYHHLGILKLISIYLFYEKKIPYEDFYNRIVDFAKNNPDSVANSSYTKLYNFFKSITKGEAPKLYVNDIYGNLTWSNNKLSHLDTIYRLDEFYDEIRPVLAEMFEDDEMLDEMISLQKTVLKLPHRNNYSADFNHDWKEYYFNALQDKYTPLKKKPLRISINNASHPDNWKDYVIESVWFGRNGITFNPGITFEDI
jgi:hypothetical protein